MRLAVFAAASLAVAGCADPPRRAEPRPAPEIRWYRDLAIDDVGGDSPAMHVDRGGGLWVAVPGVSSTAGRCRLFYRPPGGSWEVQYEGAFATELSLSSVRGGEVFFGHNLPLDGFRPRLLRVTPGAGRRVEALPAPEERIDALEYLQVGGYAISSDGEGFACGQRGSLWRRREGVWKAEPQVLPWSPGDPANRSYCQSIRFEAPDRGVLVDGDGNGAFWDGAAWRPAPREGKAELVGGARLALDGRALLRHEGGAWRRLAGELPAGPRPIFDETGRWAASPAGLVAIEIGSLRVVPGRLPFTPTAVADADGSLWALASDGVHRATQRNLPTFVSAAPGAIPAGIANAIAVDLDQDGDEDVLGLVPRAGDTALSAAALIAYLNDGAGRFTATSMGLPDDVVLWRARFDAGDVDGDGDLDVVVATAAGRVELYRHDGGRFTRAWSRDLPGATVALVDADEDGDLDLSVIPAAPGILLNNGAGVFNGSLAVPMPATRTERASWGDADGDGRADAVLLHWRDPAHLLRNTGGGYVLIELPVVAEGAAWDDIARRGTPELLAQKVHVRGVALPFARCRIVGAACAEDEPIAVPAGVVVDLNLDGEKDVIAANLRGDEGMTEGGEVFVRWPGAPATYERITAVTGAMPRPTVIDADGDGDPDVYSADRGLSINTADPRSFVRVRPRASRSDRLARGAWVVARRAGEAEIVASARAELGAATLGLPDAAARYDLSVRFPAGEQRTVRGVGAGSDIEVRDQEAWAYHSRLGLLWIEGTARRASWWRDLAVPVGAALIFLALARRARSARYRVAIPLFAIAYLGLSGSLLRSGGAAPWLLTPAAALIAAAGQGIAVLYLRWRAALRAGPYVLIERLGAGAAATVWRARAGKTLVALKLFDAGSMAVAESRERFFREARIGSEIRHPNVVRIRDAGELEDGRAYLAMELVEGRSLAEVLREGALEPARAAAIALDVARALDALHGAGIVHRDVKPENIVVRPDGAAVLTDLGLARSALFKTLTRHDVAVGTLAYMSPEQCVGRPLDGRSDLWSLGVVLHEALTGKRPFSAEHELELVYVIHNVDPPPPSSIMPLVPAPLDDLVRRCMARAPDDRFASAAEVAAALEAICGPAKSVSVSGTRPSAAAAAKRLPGASDA